MSNDFERGVRQAMEWLRADYVYGDGPEWRENGCEWIADRLAEHMRDEAWSREHYTTSRSHGCDSPAPECICGSPNTPHLRPTAAPPEPKPLLPTDRNPAAIAARGAAHDERNAP